MYSVFAPVSASHLRSSLATNSGPLSERMRPGTPFHTMTSASAPITLAEDQRPPRAPSGTTAVVPDSVGKAEVERGDILT